MSDAPREERLLEHEASHVLKRATEIEAGRGGEVSVDELRNAAIEAGIPLGAFERALSEIRATSPGVFHEMADAESAVSVAHDRASSGPTTSLRRAALVTLGAGMAWLAFALSGVFGVDINATIQFSLVLAFFAACGIVVSRTPTRDVLNFEFDLASLWVGLTLVWMLFDPSDAAAILAQMGLIGGIAGIVGGVLVGRQLLQPSDSSVDPVSEDRLFRRPTGDSL